MFSVLLHVCVSVDMYFGKLFIRPTLLTHAIHNKCLVYIFLLFYFILFTLDYCRDMKKINFIQQNMNVNKMATNSITDPVIVLSMIRLSFILVIMCGLFKRKQIDAGILFCFYITVLPLEILF